MNDIIQYFDIPAGFDAKLSALGGSLIVPQSMDDLDGIKVFMFRVHDPRWNEAGHQNQSQCFEHLARLYLPKELDRGIAVMGTFRNGATLPDSEIGLTEVFRFCIQRKIVPVAIANSKRIIRCIYEAFKEVELIVNLTSIDKEINLGVDSEPGLIGHIVKDQPNFLFNFTNIGFQTYYSSAEELGMAEMLYFDAYRLGEVRGDASFAEPLIRSSEFIHCSLEALKASDFTSVFQPEPNGFYSEEVCQMMRYAGLNEKLRAVVLTEYSASDRERDEKLLAQMLWCLLDGMAHKQSELPGKPTESFLRYSVNLKGDEYEIVFYKSLKTDRWWMEVPVPPNYVNRYMRHHLLPCSYNDYLVATRDEIPDRWWRAYQKML